MRKSILTLSMALAMLAAAAVPAAATFDPNPDFPGDFNPSNWAAGNTYDQLSTESCVDIGGCPLGGAEFEWHWQQTVAASNHTMLHAACDATVEGVIESDSLLITDVEFIDVAQGGPGQDICYNQEISQIELPWVGQICTPDGYSDPWVRLDMSIFGYDGETFGRLWDNGGGDMTLTFGEWNHWSGTFTDPSIFNNAMSSLDGTTPYVLTTHAAEVPLDGAIDVVGQGGGSCSWPELQA